VSQQTTVRDDRRVLDRLEREWAKLSRTVVTVGVHDDAGAHHGDDQPITLPQLAAIHEFGTDKIPERSFMRSTFDAKRPAYEAMIKDAAQRVTGGEDAETAARRIGVIASNDCKRTIQAGIAPPLADATKAARARKAEHGGGLASLGGATTPLIDSGQLIASITFRVDS